MGDLITLLNHLDLSPAITGLLAVILWLVKKLFDRVDKHEAESQELFSKHCTRLAVIESKLDIEDVTK